MSRNIFEAIRNHSVSVADIVKSVILRPMGGGFWLMIRAGCKQAFIARGQGSVSYAPGMSVNLGADYGQPNKSIITLPPMGRAGSSELPYSINDPGSFDGLLVYRAIPDNVSAGSSSFSVALIGSGFLASPVDSVEAVIFNPGTSTWDTDPNVTVTGVTFISTTEIHITINVSSDFPMDITGTEGLYKITYKVYRT